MDFGLTAELILVPVLPLVFEEAWAYAQVSFYFCRPQAGLKKLFLMTVNTP
jgi:hypothetical protein